MKEFDPENVIVMDGLIHALTTAKIANPEYQGNNPCSLCSLRDHCHPSEGLICQVHEASESQYYAYVGNILCAPPYDKVEFAFFADWEPC